jgi:hypothetical protein
MNQEDVLNDKCRDGVGDADDKATQKVCEARDIILGEIKTKGWCWGHDGQIGADRNWEPCQHDGSAQQANAGTQAPTPGAAQTDAQVMNPPKMGRDDMAGGHADDKWQTIQSDLQKGKKTETLADGTKILTLPNGNKVETLADGTVWAVIHPNNEMLAIQLDPNTMPTSSGFHTVMIVNLPESDIVDAPQSERIQVEGECQSRTYQIMGVLPYSGKNGGGMPVESGATEPEGVLRKVMPDTQIWSVFNLVCKKP